jgi:hypothetical protein
MWSLFFAVSFGASTPTEVNLDLEGPRRFAEALAAADSGVSLKRALRQHYFDGGSDAQRYFLRYANAARPGKLARCVQDLRPLYDRIIERLPEFEASAAEIHSSSLELEAAYPDAEFPDIHVHVGCLNSGGTASDHGLHVGLEHFSRPVDFEPPSAWLDYALHPPDLFTDLVVHELAHFQQGTERSTLLHMALAEGGADYIGERFAGEVVLRNHDFGLAHEAEIWAAFEAQMHEGPMTGHWFYEDAGKWPRDLGYFVGYRIAKAYVEQAEEDEAALRALFALEDVEAILAQSGYAQIVGGGPNR